MRHYIVIVGLLLLTLLVSSSKSFAEEPSADTLIHVIQWSLAEGGNGHWYGVIDSKHPWVVQQSLATTFVRDGQLGYLATITSSRENDWIALHMLPYGQPAESDRYFIGGYRAAGNYHWLTHESWIWSNFAPGEPNHHGTALAIYGPTSVKLGKWDDVPDDTSKFDWEYSYRALIEWGDPGVVLGDTLMRLSPESQELPIPVCFAVGMVSRFMVWTTNDVMIPWSVGHCPSWVVVSPSSGLTPREVDVHWDATGLEPGVFRDSIEILAPASSVPVKYHQLTLILQASSNPLIMEPAELNAVAVPGREDPEKQHIHVTDVNGGATPFSVWEGCPWLALDKTSGITPDSIEVRVDASNLVPGYDFDCTLVFQPQPFANCNKYALVKVRSLRCGDMNGDRAVDVTDMNRLLNYYFGFGPAPISMLAADVSGDGVVDLSDVIYLAAYLGGRTSSPCRTVSDLSDAVENSF